MADGEGSFEDVRQSVDGHPMLSLFEYAAPYRFRLALGVTAAILTRLSRLVPPVVVAVAIDRVIVVGSGAEPGLLATVGLLPSTPITGTAARLDLLRRLVLIAGLAYLVRSVSRFLSRYVLQSTAQKIQRDLRDDAYDHLQHLSLDFFANHQTGGMMSILNSDVNRLEKFLNTEIRQAIRVVATVGGIAALMFYYSPTLALIALAPVPVIAVASGKFLSWIEPRYRNIRETVARLNSRLENNIGGARVIKAFNRHGFEHDRVADQSQQYHDEKVGAIRLRRAFFATLRLTTGAVFVALLFVGGQDVILGGTAAALSAGSFALFFMLIRRLYSPLRRIGKTANKYQLAKSSSERVFGLLGTEPTVTSPADPHAPEDVAGDVAFDDVTFGYGDGETVLRNVDLDVEAGQTVGLAGPTGAGKSTLLKLIPRFYDVNGRDPSAARVATDGGRTATAHCEAAPPGSEGSEGGPAVRIDGVDVREWDLPTLRDHVGIVEQDPYMFAGTAAENVRYGDLEASREEVVEAAKAAEAHEFVSELPDGYDTQIGERGVKLSGGQRQRLAIARALLNDPEIVILDEATSDVDTETEERIQRSLAELTADRTAFVIAHRLSTIKEADRIAVLEEGRVVEQGDHGDLVARNGQYADLWAAQSGERTAVADD